MGQVVQSTHTTNLSLKMMHYAKLMVLAGVRTTPSLNLKIMFHKEQAMPRQMSSARSMPFQPESLI